MAKISDLPVQFIAARPSLVAHAQPAVLASQLFDQPTHCICPVGDLAPKANLARASGLGYRDGDRLFVRVHGDKHPAILLHGSSPVSEARRRPTQRNPRA